MMEEIYEKTLLYDFYGELLTEHQKHIYERALFDDLSLSEIADSEGITRQGVHDIIRRCNKILADYEDKLQLVAKFVKNRQEMETILHLSESVLAQPEAFSAEQKESLQQIESIARNVIEEF